MKLWAKNVKTDEVMQELTVGDDRIHDAFLLPFDVLASAAHARVLEQCGILSDAESSALVTALETIHTEASKDSVTIPPDFEDVHSYLEDRLTKTTGEAGKKIHTGRSRNDQVITAMRLFLREAVVSGIESLCVTAALFAERFEKDSAVIMPGYTHLQPAMPTTAGAWMHAFLEGTLELIRDGIHLAESLDTNPLGAAAGFGSSLPLDREASAALLGFSRAQRSFIDIQNSRGRYEERFLSWCTQIGALYEKFAWDVELFCTKEFGFVALPEEFTTGSSIMPQKKNPDIVELLRARCSAMRGLHSQIQWVGAKLPSNYHRDLQLTKGPVIEGYRNLGAILNSLRIIVPNFILNLLAVSERLDPGIFATYEAYKLVRLGMPFRDAYKKTAETARGAGFNPEDYQAEMKIVVDEIAAYFKKSAAELESLGRRSAAWRARLDAVPEKVFGKR